MNKQWLHGLFIALLTVISVTPNAAHAFGAQRVPLMVGLGDSLSAAALADTSTQKNWPIPWGLPFPSMDDPSDILGFRSDFENKRTLSWVSGVSLQSHHKRLQKYMKAQGKPLWVFNFAESGAASDSLSEQIDEIETALRFGLFDSIPYMTLLMGANDLCKSVPIETFHENVHKAFEKIAAIRTKDGQPIRILVSSIPRIPDLGDSRVQEYRTAAGYRCRIVRNMRFSYCKNMTQWKTEEEHQKLNGLVDQVNDILRAETLEAARKFPQLQTHFSPALSENRLEPADLAMDCFHPSAAGQAKVAEFLWNDQPWFH